MTWNESEQASIERSILQKRASRPGRTRAGCLQIVILLVILIAAQGTHDVLREEAWCPRWLRALAAVLVFLGLVALFGHVLDLVSRRKTSQTRSPVRHVAESEAPEPSVFYLRSFLAEQPAKLDAQHAVLTFEEELAYALGPVGTLCGLPFPGDDSLPSGVAWIRLADAARWRERARDLALRSKLVVIQADATPGLRWEIENLLPEIPRDRLLVVMPQRPRMSLFFLSVSRARALARRLAGFNQYGTERRYESFREAAPYLELPEYRSVKGALAMRFVGGKTVIVARKRPPPRWLSKVTTKGWPAHALREGIASWEEAPRDDQLVKPVEPLDAEDVRSILSWLRVGLLGSGVAQVATGLMGMASLVVRATSGEEWEPGDLLWCPTMFGGGLAIAAGLQVLSANRRKTCLVLAGLTALPYPDICCCIRVPIAIAALAILSAPEFRQSGPQLRPAGTEGSESHNGP